MAITDRFVLAAGTLIQPAFELPEALRGQIAAGESDFVLSRPGSRSLAKVIDRDAALLIAEFEKPSSIAHAVARFSRGRAEDPEELLETALPLVQSLMVAGLLVEPNSPQAESIRASLAPGTEVDGWSVTRCVQTQQDTELYQARDENGRYVAVKICRSGEEFAAAALSRESRLLSALDGKVNPRLLAEGEWSGRRYLTMEWVEGVDAITAAAEFRRRGDVESLQLLMRLTGTILEAYAHLHSQQTLHGDVHPRNILVDGHGTVRIVDFGLGRRVDDPAWAGFALRGGVSFFLEPELARAMLGETPTPPASAAGEQYELAAVLHHLMTGSYYVDFNLERQQMLRQIAASPMAPFATLGLEPWPELEELLAKALSKDPAARFQTVAELARRWQKVQAPERAAAAVSVAGNGHGRIHKEFLSRIGLRGSLLRPGSLPAPTTSLNFGSAGVAYAIYRVACASDNGQLLALADLWCVRALSEAGGSDAFSSAEMDITPEKVAGNSLWHGPSGVYLVQAMIARARGDLVSQLSAASAFLRIAEERSGIPDLTLGNAGALLGCVRFLDLLRDEASATVRELSGRVRRLGGEIAAEMWRTIDGYGAIRDCAELSNPGMAHGWAGLLYATLAWCAASGESMPGSLRRRLEELAALGEPAGRGLQWEWDLVRAHQSMPGWCNGSAGYVFLWTAAHAAFGDAEWMRLAEGAAWDAWDTPSSAPTLCCGTAGQAYALLNLFRYSGERVWLRRAQELAQRSAAAPWERDHSTTEEFRPLSLYKGNPGIAVLELDLESPQDARMPIFERDV
ncbi:MAG: lanthionine synthetase LanC family protein [Acidobacteriaceae bacterium]